MKKLCITVFFLFAGMLAREACAQTSGLLFILERSKNANQVRYEARITREGTIDPVDPIHVFWLNRVKDTMGTTREELSLIEKNMVYGCKVDKKDHGKHIFMTIVSYPDRRIKVSMQDGKAVAETDIGGQVSYLDKVFIKYRETRMFPKVNFIELFGRSVKNGDVQYEKIKVK